MASRLGAAASNPFNTTDATLLALCSTLADDIPAITRPRRVAV